MPGPTILISAGEPSGDLHGAGVMRALKVRWPDARILGLGGPRMVAEGLESLADFERLAVMGFAEVAARLPYFVRLLRETDAELERSGVDLVLPIDYPGFNMRLARAARRRGVPVLYYIAPQVWAWHRSRMKDLARNTDRLAVILPFETELMNRAGANARFVGHPLLDRADECPDRDTFCAATGLDPKRPILALFPGSRAQEVGRHLQPFLGAADRIRAQRADIQPVLAASDTLDPELYDSSVPLSRDGRALLHHAHGALVKSGTTTLETALSGTPMVVAYRTHPLTFWIAERLVDIEHIALVNLVAGERLVPELLQDDVEPQTLADALLPLLEEGSRERTRVLDGLARVRGRLEPDRRPDASTAERVADLAAELMAA